MEVTVLFKKFHFVSVTTGERYFAIGLNETDAWLQLLSRFFYEGRTVETSDIDTVRAIWQIQKEEVVENLGGRK